MCCASFGNGGAEVVKIKETQLIRRAYLDVLNVPPSVKELEWYQVYNTNGYEVAVDTILSRPPNFLIPSLKNTIRDFLLSLKYRTKEPVLLTLEQRDFIVKYQSGGRTNIEDADKQLILNAIASNEPGVMEPMDYLAECLLGRDTTAVEATHLNKILKRYPSEEEGYLEVLKEIKTFKDFYTK